MPDEKTAVTDFIKLNPHSASNVVGNEQWADTYDEPEPGQISGPDPAQWGDPNREPGDTEFDPASLRPEPAVGDHDEELGLSGPDPDQWDAAAREERGALPNPDLVGANPDPGTPGETVEIGVGDVADVSAVLTPPEG
jgi:hypothetical protein